MQFNFKEFYKVLESLFTKKRLKFPITEQNFSVFLLNRYISFYHPSYCKFINMIANKNGLFEGFTLEDCYEYYFHALPKNAYKFIKYFKKESSKKTYDKGITNDELLACADYHEISKREVLIYLEELDKVN